MDELSVSFVYLRPKFPTIHEAKMKERIFAGSQITQLFGEKDFRTKLNFKERRAWKAFENFCRNFLGNEIDENYSEIVQDLISSQSAMGCNMPLTRHFLYSRLEFFPENTVAVSDGHDENFNQDISRIEKGYSGKWISDMLAAYCCSLIRETQTGENNIHKKLK